MRARSDFADRYESAVGSYIGSGDESALQTAYELGREALEAGLGPLVLFSIHRDVVGAQSSAGVDPGRVTRDATSFLIEALAPFHIAYTGADEARHTAAALRSLIEHQSRELDRLAEDLGGVPRAAAVTDVRELLVRHLRDLDGLGMRLDKVHSTAEARRRQIADIVHAQEQERRSLAGEIHDDALQVMSAVLMRLGMVARHISDPGERAVIEQLEASAREAIRRLRRLLAGLQPPELGRSGLGAAVRSALERLESDFAIGCTLSICLDLELDPEAATVAYRIIQEALANARKHARASAINVILETSDGGVLARVTDDGIGFDSDAAIRESRSGHLGLQAMRERAILAGGRLAISSVPGRTSVEFWLPCGDRPEESR